MGRLPRWTPRKRPSSPGWPAPLSRVTKPLQRPPPPGALVGPPKHLTDLTLLHCHHPLEPAVTARRPHWSRCPQVCMSFHPPPRVETFVGAAGDVGPFSCPLYLSACLILHSKMEKGARSRRQTPDNRLPGTCSQPDSASSQVHPPASQRSPASASPVRSPEESHAPGRSPASWLWDPVPGLQHLRLLVTHRPGVGGRQMRLLWEPREGLPCG